MLPPASQPRLVDSGLTGRVNQQTSYFTKILTEGIVRFWARETQGVIGEIIHEAGNVGALAAIMNAVVDALAPLGINHMDMPATPEKVWRAIRDAD